RNSTDALVSYVAFRSRDVSPWTLSRHVFGNLHGRRCQHRADQEIARSQSIPRFVSLGFDSASQFASFANGATSASPSAFRSADARLAAGPIFLFTPRTFSLMSFPYGDPCSISAFSSAPIRIARPGRYNHVNRTMKPPNVP